MSIRAHKAGQRHLKAIQQAPRRMHLGIRSAMFTVGAEDVRHMRSLIENPPKTGRMYGTHQASAPGEAPADRTGVLKRSADYIVRGGTQLEVGESAPYAKYLEDGTARMAARPHVKRTREERSREAFLTLQRVPLAALKGKRR